MSMPFEMQITDIFRLSHGQTVFAGIISGDTGLVLPGICTLHCAGEYRQEVGGLVKMMLSMRAPTNLRAIATMQSINLSREEAQSGQCKLVGD